MQSVANSKIAGAVLVLLGFACWLIASAVIPVSSEWFFFSTYAVAGLAFFLVGCFLPEHHDHRSFLGRRSALQLMAFFFWLAVSALGRVTMFRDAWGFPATVATVLVTSSIVIVFGSYYFAIYLIRGFRAPPPCYAASKEEETEQDAPSNGGQRPSLNSGLPPRRG